MIKVELQRTRGGSVDEEAAEFSTPEEAREWAGVMSSHYGYRKIYIDGVEYTPKGTNHG